MIHAGQIIHVAGRNVIDRIQSAGLGDTRVPTDTIREVGNRAAVDKVQGDPEFSFSVESFDVTTELEAWLAGKIGTGTGPTNGPGAADAPGTVYDWLDMVGRSAHITSPWKENASGGDVLAGHIIPSYYPTRIRYRFGIAENASQTVEMAGGAFYYADGAPVEEFYAGDGTDTTFLTTNPAMSHRIGGAGGTVFKRILGVLVDGVPQTLGLDYTESGPQDGTAVAVTVTFATAPANGADIRIVYFTGDPEAWPDTVNASSTVKPAAVRGRNICVYLDAAGARVKVGGMQAAELEATVDGELTREFCNTEAVGRTVNGTDATGTLTQRARDKDAFLAMLSKVTGVATTEVFGWLNTHQVPLTIQIQDPKAPGTILKTLHVPDAVFQIPGTSARVNSATDHEFRFESASGTYRAIKGSYLP